MGEERGVVARRPVEGGIWVRIERNLFYFTSMRLRISFSA